MRYARPVTSSARLKARRLLLLVSALCLLLTVFGLRYFWPAIATDDHQQQHQEEQKRKSRPTDDALANSLVQRGDQQSLHSEESSTKGRVPAEHMFSIVMLTYKAPKSLVGTLQSLVSSGLVMHPHLFEVVVYFQLFNQHEDEALLHKTLGSTGVRYRSIGRPDNLPVAKATFIAIRSVVTELVMYLECDRPVYAFPLLTAIERQDHVHRLVTNSIRAIATDGIADVVRLQLYANSLVPDDAKSLPLDKYGPNTLENCFRAGSFTSNVCSNSKALKKRPNGRVFYTAYCKHWSKVTDQRIAPQQDMCDSFCFFVWASIAHTLQERQGKGFEDVRQLLSKISTRSRFTNVSASSSPATAIFSFKQEEEKNDDHDDDARKKRNTNVSFVASDQQQILCLTSEDCNWTNQPAMYKKAWYLKMIAEPCEASTGFCIGKEGRQSAVRQELFFVKNRDAWAARKHKICIAGAGLFIHHEVDNSE